MELNIERLAHFECDYCDKWWAIGDPPERGHWWCPWCGEKNVIETKVKCCDENSPYCQEGSKLCE